MGKLRELRESRVISLEELARQAGISSTTLSQVERGMVMPKVRTIRRLAEALQMDASALRRMIIEDLADLGEAEAGKAAA